MTKTMAGIRDGYGEGSFFRILGGGCTDGNGMGMRRDEHGSGDGYRVEYIREGVEYVRGMEGEVLTVTAGQMFFVRAGYGVSLWWDREKPCRRIWFRVQGSLVESLFTLCRMPDIYAAHSPALPEILDLWTLTGESGDTDSYARAASLFSAMLLRTMGDVLFPATGREEGTARQMQAYIDGHLYEDLSLEALGARFGYAKMHLITLFRTRYGITPIQYVLQKRMDAAGKMLLGTVMSVGEIGALFRYSSAQHFSDAFRKHMGVTPAVYRKNGGLVGNGEKEEEKEGNI